jgi:hypothetical protein
MTSAKQTSSNPRNEPVQNTTATIEIAVAGRRPHTRRVEYTRLVAAVDTLQSIETPNKWLKRLVQVKLTHARAWLVVLTAEVRS